MPPQIKNQRTWAGTVCSEAQYLSLTLPYFAPDNSTPHQDTQYVDGNCYYCGGVRSFRMDKSLWHPKLGYNFRESLSCSGCALNARMRAFFHFLTEHGMDLSGDQVYITEKLTPMFRALVERYPRMQGSEYFDNVPTGTHHLGAQVEDLMQLTFESESFDTVLSFDVLEHVPDYQQAFQEIYRVLRPGGRFIGTFPFDLDLSTTFARAEIDAEGEIVHLEEPEYHGNPVGSPSLCFTEFGWDLLAKLRRIGFSQVSVTLYADEKSGYYGREQPIFYMCRPTTPKIARPHNASQRPTF